MLRNVNDYQRDYNSWNAAAASQAQMREMQQRASDENLRKHQEMKKYGFGDPNTRGAIEGMYAQISPMEQMANQHHMNMVNAASHAMNNEMAQVQDRKMDLADNEQGRKNLDTEYSRQIEMEKLAAAERMNERNNQGLDSLSNSFSGIADGLISDPMQVPNYDLYDNGKNRIGGSYFGNALLG